MKVLSDKPSSVWSKNLKEFKAFNQKSLQVIKRAQTIKKSLTSLVENQTNKVVFKDFENLYYSNFLQSYYLKETLTLAYVKLLVFNNLIFKNAFLMGLKKTLQKLYNKKVFLNLVNQKYFYLNSDIFIKVLATRIRDRKARALIEMRKALSKVALPKFNLYLSKKKSSLNLLDQKIVNSIKYKHVNGIRIEAAGRLSKRLTASRSVFKLAYIGNLKSTDLTLNKKSSVMLRGGVKPNLSYTNLNMKTRNGAFGLKG